MYLKVMSKSYKGHKYFLCIIDEGTNYVITVPIYQSRLKEIGDALTENVIAKYCVPNYIVMEQNSAFLSTLMNYLFQKLDINIKKVASYNQQSLQVEHGIKSLPNILIKHLTDHRQMWPKYLPVATLAYNTFNSPNLGNYSYYKLVFGGKPKMLLNLETNADVKVSGTYKGYYTLLNKRLQFLHKVLQDFKSKRLGLINKDRNFFQYNIENLVYIISSLIS